MVVTTRVVSTLWSHGIQQARRKKGSVALLGPETHRRQRNSHIAQVVDEGDASVAVLIGHEWRDELVHVRVAIALWSAAHPYQILQALPHAPTLGRIIIQSGRPVVGVELVNVLGQTPRPAGAIVHRVTRALERGREVCRQSGEADRQHGERHCSRDGVVLRQGCVRAVTERCRQL